MEHDYRSLQQRILAAYQQWQHEARSATLAHLQWAQKLNLPDIIARDEFWLEKLDALPDVPRAVNVPYQRDWLGMVQGAVWHSGLGKPYPAELQALMGKPFNKKRQAQIDTRVAHISACICTISSVNCTPLAPRFATTGNIGTSAMCMNGLRICVGSMIECDEKRQPENGFFHFQAAFICKQSG